VRPLLCTAALLLLAGCGGSASPPEVRQPHLPHALATSWRAQADAVAAALAAGDGCTARTRADTLRSSVIGALNAHRVSPRFQETLTGAVNDLASRISCTPPAPAPTPKPHGHPKKPHPPHGHGHGHGRKK
jgi:hypothetical protein